MNLDQANGFFSILDFGAVGDGKTDCTDAIQAAIEAAAKVHGTVWVPAGHFLTGEIHLAPGVNLRGMNCSTYCRDQGSCLCLREDDTSRCLLDLSDSHGNEVADLVIQAKCKSVEEGARMVHGVLLLLNSDDSCNHATEKGYGNCVTLDHVEVKGFNGDAGHFQNAGVVVVRHCIFGGGRHCLWFNVWDGWILDCMLPGGHGAGIFSDQCIASITITGNRIEWNGLGGIVVKNAYRLSISGNTIDHTGCEAMKFEDSNTLAITGNIIWRPGKGPYLPVQPEDKYSYSAVRFRRCRGVTMTGNAFHAGLEDGDGGRWTPDYCLVLEGLKHSVITGNSLWGCAMKEAVVDRGGDNEGLILKDNAVTLASGDRD